MGSLLLEARPYRPFTSNEEYLIAMREDLAEWFQTMYPHLKMSADNFMDKLETGVVLCEHANKVKAQAIEYVDKKQAKKAAMTRSVTGSVALAQSLIRIPDVKYFASAKPNTFFARDNVSNFIKWCRNPLEILECLLFESDDLIMRKNEKHVILCLLEVARRGAKFGMLAPMLVQMERQIDREIAADMKKMDWRNLRQHEDEHQVNGLDEEDDSDMEDENPVLMYGPMPQIVTNDLKSLDEMVRELVEKCTCPTQFPMIRVSEGKYRIGDTKVLIFVRILRNHVMVRVGGGWDTLSHYLDKHDPCRCRSQHRTTQSAKLVNKPGAPDLHGSQVYYDRSPVVNFSSSGNTLSSPYQTTHLGPPMNSLNRSRSRSPSHLYHQDPRRSVSPNFSRKSLVPPPNRSRSPTPNFTSTHQTKLMSSSTNNRSPKHSSTNTSPVHLPKSSPKHNQNNQHVISLLIPAPENKNLKSEASLQVSDSLTDHSDTTSELSDEGYRSLGVVQDKGKQRGSFHSQNSTEDAEDNEHPVDGMEDINDMGLRKTQFSQRIYDDSKKPTFSSSTPRATSLERPSSTDHNNANNLNRSPKHLPPKKSASSSKINTWNGRPKTSRASLNADTFTQNFVRQSPARRSASAMPHHHERRSSSACTSPTKNRLQQELMEVAKFEDETLIFEKIQSIVEQYKNTKGGLDGEFQRGGERMSFRSPRKDSKPDNHLSRIPAPVSHRA